MALVSGSTIVGLPGRAALPLATAPAGGLMGWVSPVAVPSPDGQTVAYNTFSYLIPVEPEKSWSQQGVHPGDAVGTPSIHLVDLTTGKDTVLANGAFSLAWRADGAVAYMTSHRIRTRAMMLPGGMEGVGATSRSRDLHGPGAGRSGARALALDEISQPSAGRAGSAIGPRRLRPGRTGCGDGGWGDGQAAPVNVVYETTAPSLGLNDQPAATSSAVTSSPTFSSSP